MWNEFKRQLSAGSGQQERKTRDGKRPLDSMDFMPMREEDLEDMDEVEKAYADMLNSAND